MASVFLDDELKITQVVVARIEKDLHRVWRILSARQSRSSRRVVQRDGDEQVFSIMINLKRCRVPRGQRRADGCEPAIPQIVRQNFGLNRPLIQLRALARSTPSIAGAKFKIHVDDDSASPSIAGGCA